MKKSWLSSIKLILNHFDVFVKELESFHTLNTEYLNKNLMIWWLNNQIKKLPI